MNRILHVHIPRTAGRSVRESLVTCGDHEWRSLVTPVGHPTVHQIEAMSPAAVNDADLIFTVVRNPWDWRHSWYRWLRMCENGSSGHPVAEQLCMIATFREHLFAMRKGIEEGAFTTTFYGGTPSSLFTQPQHAYIGAPHRVKILRFETLDRDFKDTFGQPLRHHVGRSHQGNYRDAYDDETRKLVGAIYAEDIERFGYEF